MRSAKRRCGCFASPGPTSSSTPTRSTAFLQPSPPRRWWTSGVGARSRDAALTAVPATVEIGGSHALYDRLRDVVRLPAPERFHSAADFRATRWHELAHWTGGAPRLDRAFGQRFGDEAYAFEELVAELASVILGMTLGVPPTVLDGHASYIAGWVKVLKGRPQALLEAAGHAQRAVDHLLAYGRPADAALAA